MVYCQNTSDEEEFFRLPYVTLGYDYRRKTDQNADEFKVKVKDAPPFPSDVDESQNSMSNDKIRIRAAMPEMEKMYAINKERKANRKLLKAQKKVLGYIL